MPSYGRVFAQIYNVHFAGYAEYVAPRLIELYQQTSAGQARQPVLDLCCGTGQLAQVLLEHGYSVTGLDLSPDMLAIARQNNAAYVDSGRARFVQGDAADYSLDERFGMVISTYDALNHLDSLDALQACFRATANAILPGGLFAFDLNTRRGLHERWNSLSVREMDEGLVVQQGLYDGQGDKAHVRISGFWRNSAGQYERFAETLFNTVYPIQAVLECLHQVGWQGAYAARLADLTAPVAEPEQEGRVFIVTRWPAAAD